MWCQRRKATQLLNNSLLWAWGNVDRKNAKNPRLAITGFSRGPLSDLNLHIQQTTLLLTSNAPECVSHESSSCPSVLTVASFPVALHFLGPWVKLFQLLLYILVIFVSFQIPHMFPGGLLQPRWAHTSIQDHKWYHPVHWIHWADTGCCSLPPKVLTLTLSVQRQSHFCVTLGFCNLDPRPPIDTFIVSSVL